MSSSALLDRPLLRWGAYALAVALFAAEAAVVWLMLHPNPADDFRAYYIDRSTTCLNQPFPGTYEFGTVVDFTSDGRDLAKPLWVCGWEGPAGDGTHAVGTSSRLRMNGAPPTGPLELDLAMVAVRKNGVPQPQRVEVMLDGTPAATVFVTGIDSEAPDTFRVPVPPEALADGNVEIEFRFPDAVQMGRTDPDSRFRSVKLVHAGIVPAGQNAVEGNAERAPTGTIATSTR